MKMCDNSDQFVSVHIFLIILILANGCGGEQISRPSPDFKSHTITKPILHHGRTRRQLHTTKNIDGGHHSTVTLTVPVDLDGEELILDLELNEDLVPGDHTLQFQEGGRTVNYKHKREELDLCHYHGTVRGKSNSRAAVSTCRGVSGVIFDGTRTRYIEPAEGSEIRSRHFLYDLNDLNTTHHCGHHDTQTHPEISRQDRQSNDGVLSRYKRRTHAQIHEPYNANEGSRYIELVLVADRTVFQNKGSNLNVVYSEMIEMANILNSVYYAPLNIFIALVGVIVWNNKDKVEVTNQYSEQVLTAFVKYRSNEVSKKIPNDIALLITGQTFIDSAVIGKAYVNVMCEPDYSGGVINYHSSTAGQIVSTLAHEMGHTLNMKHDTPNCLCDDHDCTMSTYNNGKRQESWSSCSLEYLQQFFDNGGGHCLLNKPQHLFQSPTCGNGFIEPGEECDCGLVRRHTGERNQCQKCCNPTTCRLRVNATCAAGVCCDLTECRTKTAGTVCRRAEQECDLPEYCTGNSGFCPNDVYQMDTTPCGWEGRYMCKNRQCMPLPYNRRRISVTHQCPANCSGHGVCNSAGHCHCDAGLAPPLCNVPGPGGSEDSGPAMYWKPNNRNPAVTEPVGLNPSPAVTEPVGLNPSPAVTEPVGLNPFSAVTEPVGLNPSPVGEESKTWIYVVVGVIILCIILIIIMFLAYYYRQNILLWWQQKQFIKALTCNCCHKATLTLRNSLRRASTGLNFPPTKSVSKEQIWTTKTSISVVANKSHIQKNNLSTEHREQSPTVTDYFQNTIRITGKIDNLTINKETIYENMDIIAKLSNVNPMEANTNSESSLLTQLKMSKLRKITRDKVQTATHDNVNQPPILMRQSHKNIIKEDIQVITNEQTFPINAFIPMAKPVKKITKDDIQIVKHEKPVNLIQKPLRMATNFDNQVIEPEKNGPVNSYMALKRSKNPNIVDTCNLIPKATVVKSNDVKSNFASNTSINPHVALKPHTASTKPNIDVTLRLKTNVNVNTPKDITHNFVKSQKTDKPNVNFNPHLSNKSIVDLKNKSDVKPNVAFEHKNVKPMPGTANVNVKPKTSTRANEKPSLFTDVKLKPVNRKPDI